MPRRGVSASNRQVPAKPNAPLRRRISYLAAILVIGAALAWLVERVIPNRRADRLADQNEHQPRASLIADDRFDVPEAAESRFRNASATVEHVGSQACTECHRDEHRSYLQTTHSRSLGDIDVSREPPDGEFFHELSGRHYRIYREGKTLKLREFIQDADGREVVLVDCAARFALGSGNYARMYLVKVDDFLIEAPVTWYPRRQVWGMSAGYEKNPHQPGFSREIDTMCLYCHAGQVEPIDGANLRLNVAQMAIGCERCHGPGSLHVAERKSRLPIHGSVDDSIVNLRHLPRERQEDVCAQCHLSGSADVSVRGRSKADFRPGMRMSDFSISYRIDRPDSEMTVSGQIQQMRLSRCYLESKTMTCATCHNPHSLPDESEKVEYFRSKCLNCHQTDSCGVSIEARRQQQANDSCVACHMPRGPTDIPHFSFTHHRVGIHVDKPSREKLTESDRLVPIGDVSHLPEYERQRLLGLANDVFAGRLFGGLDDESRGDPAYRALSVVFEGRGRQILEEVRSRGMRDPDVESFFARLNWRRNPDLSIAYAESALRSKRVSPPIRNTALYNLASSYFDRGQYAQAFPYLKELVSMERREITLMLLAICYEREGNLQEAVRLINAAISDSPGRADLHIYLASVYRKMGKSKDAESQLQLAKLLKLKVPQPE